MNDVYRHIGHLTNRQMTNRHPEIDVRWTGRGACRMTGCMSGTRKSGINHSKLLVVDGRRAVVGSSNLDFLSTKHASELNLEIDDPSGQLARAFAIFWNEADESADESTDESADESADESTDESAELVAEESDKVVDRFGQVLWVAAHRVPRQDLSLGD
jgi:phosphatidylserine/phosphatidylglycerophosphate/cardiolipin synthase-like enzyme